MDNKLTGLKKCDKCMGIGIFECEHNTSKITNMPDIKQRAHKLLEERLRNVSLADAIYTDFGYGCMECGGGIKESWVKSFIDEIIDIAVAEERERVVGMMGHYTIKCKESRRIADLTIEQFISIITEPKPKLSAEALNIK